MCQLAVRSRSAVTQQRPSQHLNSDAERVQNAAIMCQDEGIYAEDPAPPPAHNGQCSQINTTTCPSHANGHLINKQCPMQALHDMQQC